MPAQWYHFIGIGGAGMSALAKILLSQGHRVSGSDIAYSAILERLKIEGAEVFLGHAPENLHEGVETVIFSTAIPLANPELKEAKKRGLPILSRGELLARFMRDFKGIAVVGAHGKTTTTAMISLVLSRNGLDPTYLIGGEVNDIGGNARLGKGDCLVAEADESDGSFLLLEPHIGVITNIDNDHLDYYKNVEEIERSFQRFVSRLQPGGFLIYCADDQRLRQLDFQSVPSFSYGIYENADYQAKHVVQKEFKSEAIITYNNCVLGKLKLNVPGVHNIQNALAAVAVGTKLGLGFPAIAKALAGFQGVQRRFQLIASIDGIKIIDDYAHHPTEIRTLLSVAQRLKYKRLIVVFQPHRYTRTLFLKDQFATAFAGADLVIVADIYPAGEKPIPGVSAQIIADALVIENQPAIYLGQMAEIEEYLAEEGKAGDIILTVGAGDVWRAGRHFAEILKKRQSDSDKVSLWTGKS